MANRSIEYDGRRRQRRNSNWVYWLFGPMLAVVMLFICGISAFVLLKVAENADIFAIAGRESSAVELAPPVLEEEATVDGRLPVVEGGGLVSPVEPQGEPIADAPEPVAEAVAEQPVAASEPVSESQPVEEPNPQPPVEEPVEQPIVGVPTVTLPAPPPTAEPVVQAPIPTATIPPNGSVTAARVWQPFVIDGNLEGWGNIASYASTFRVYTMADWDGTDDSSAFWRMAWDDNNLYIAVVVTDDTHVQVNTGNQIFRGDSLELQLDTDRDGDYGPGLSPDDFQLVISPGDFGNIGPSIWRFRGNEFGQSMDAPGHSINVASQRIDGGYAVELAIPWYDLGMQPDPARFLSVALSVNDNDAYGTARQEMMKSHVATRSLTDPNTWGLMILGN